MDRKQQLALALEKEKDSLPEYNGFGEKNNLNDFAQAIKYLRTGKIPKNYENNELLVAVMEDFETICSDYGV